MGTLLRTITFGGLALLHLGCGGTANILYPDASPDAAADAAADSRPGDSTSSDGSTDACVVGETRERPDLYIGPDGTLGIGLCRPPIEICELIDTAVAESVPQFVPSDDQVTPLPEIPGDGIDQDCDGSDDECLAGREISDYSGPPDTRGVVPCQDRILTCEDRGEGAQYYETQPEVLPMEEILGDGLDQDCNGFDDSCIEGRERQSYSGGSETRDVGICQNRIETCEDRGEGLQYYETRPERTPIAEIPDDGIDQDCDGADLPMCSRIGSEVRVTDDDSDADLSASPSLLWTGRDYGLVWSDCRDADPPPNSEIYFAHISPEGAKIGSDIRLTHDLAWARTPSLAWNGSGYGVSWWNSADYRENIYFARISPDGSSLGLDIRVTDSPISSVPSLVWTGREFGIAYYDGREWASGGAGEIYFVRISPEGVRIGSESRITDEPNTSSSSSLVWNGTEYAVAWTYYDAVHADNFEIRFARISPEGARIGSAVQIAEGFNLRGWPSLVWTESEYGVAWGDTRDGSHEIYFARISPEGVVIRPETRVTDTDGFTSAYPSLVWTGSKYGITWTDERDGNPEIYFAKISSDGRRIESEARVTDTDGLDSAYPSLVWTGSEFGVAWADERFGIYFARIRCLDDE